MPNQHELKPPARSVKAAPFDALTMCALELAAIWAAAFVVAQVFGRG